MTERPGDRGTCGGTRTGGPRARTPNGTCTYGWEELLLGLARLERPTVGHGSIREVDI